MGRTFDLNVDLFMYLIEGIRFGKCKVRRMNWTLASPLLACESIRFFRSDDQK